MHFPRRGRIDLIGHGWVFGPYAPHGSSNARWLPDSVQLPTGLESRGEDALQVLSLWEANRVIQSVTRLRNFSE
jgi:hypothetical protein